MKRSQCLAFFWLAVLLAFAGEARALYKRDRSLPNVRATITVDAGLPRHQHTGFAQILPPDR
jgi:hypothetical protein